MEEALTCTMSSHVTFIIGFTLRPYRALWHTNYPTYAPREAILQIILPCGDGDPSGGLTLYESEPFQVECSNRIQHFYLPTPILVGGIAKIILRGAYQRQTSDNKYYVCISHATILGVPMVACICDIIHQPVDNPPMTMKFSSVLMNDRNPSAMDNFDEHHTDAFFHKLDKYL